MPTNLQPSEVLAFQAYIYRFFDSAGRAHLPWRKKVSPYQIMVSEIMLQQTQVDRVIPKFEAFVARFPTSESLAKAPVADVIRLWQGLGYNRRVLNLQKAAQKIVAEYQNQVPRELEELLKLPGIGPYTATAIQAFAFNLPSIVIETNIRTVFIFHFFHGADKVLDNELLPLIELTLDRSNPQRWYSALMDYGTYLKQQMPNPSRQSQTYTKQSPFKGSNRQIRGQILRLVSESGSSGVSEDELATALGEYSTKSQNVVKQMIKEGFVVYEAGQLSLPKA